jgi:PIN domain nuclease of toxin-antitoxin system
MEPDLVHLDTQILVWLYADPQRSWPTRVRNLLNNGRLRYSPMVRLELRYLYEIGRIKVSPEVLLGELSVSLVLTECDLPFSQVIDAAERIQWTRDPFDRLIVAYATAANAELMTADRLIREHFPGAVWEVVD